MKMTKRELLRLEELEINAKDKFIENSDYRVEDWLDTEKDKKEYKKLFKKFLKIMKKTK